MNVGRNIIMGKVPKIQDDNMWKVCKWARIGLMGIKNLNMMFLKMFVFLCKCFFEVSLVQIRSFKAPTTLTLAIFTCIVVICYPKTPKLFHLSQLTLSHPAHGQKLLETQEAN
jgi:hypothetical protein